MAFVVFLKEEEPQTDCGSSNRLMKLVWVRFTDSRTCACSKPSDKTGRACSVKLQVLLLLFLQGPASQQVHEEEVKTLISEAVLAKEAEHTADLTRLQQGFEAQLQECEEDLKDRDRYYVVTCNIFWVDTHWALNLLLYWSE